MPALIRSSTLKLSLNGTFVAILLCFTGSSPSKGRHARKELGNKWCWRVDVRKFPCVLYRFRLQVVDGHGYRERTSKKGRHPASGERERERVVASCMSLSGKYCIVIARMWVGWSVNSLIYYLWGFG